MKTADIELKKLIIGKNQHRTQSVGSEIDELAENIKVRGLLQPIRVVEADAPNEGKYEIIMGQRRFLACRQLGWKEIPAIISKKKQDKVEYLIDSVSENTLRKDTTNQENKDVCAILWRRHQSIRAIVDATGLSEYFVRKHVKWASLPPELREIVDDGTVDLDAATKAVEVSQYDENQTIEETIEIAKELGKMTSGQRTQVKRKKKENQEVDSKEIIKSVENEDQIPVIPISLTRASYDQLETTAKTNKTDIRIIASQIVENAINDNRGE